MPPSCTHLDSVKVRELPAEIAGCEDCLAIGSSWLHLRMCQTCGQIGCCDSSPNRHASKHAAASGHPIVRSAEPGENWSWCYVDEVAFFLGD
ncbi:MAG TPA: UBP-type zinc finger domain-containing protein [Solirubrobacterales bacterium]